MSNGNFTHTKISNYTDMLCITGSVSFFVMHKHLQLNTTTTYQCKIKIY